MARSNSRPSPGRPKRQKSRRISAKSAPSRAPKVDQNATVQESAVGSFARHETFTPRFGWLRKGFTAVSAEPSLFSKDDSHLQLGVGKNMARSISFWCAATGLTQRVTTGGRAEAFPTELGKRLLGARGWDPYLEDLGSLWILHWQLVRRAETATAWHYAFTRFPDVEFSAETLADSLVEFASVAYSTTRVAQSSFHKDATCIVRMYAETGPSIGITEETLRSPFSDLGLIRPLPQVGGVKDRRYSFDFGPKPGLTAAVVAAVVADFANSISPGARTMTVSRLFAEPGSPGMAFKLRESTLVEYLEEASNLRIGVRFGESAGLRQLAFDCAPGDLIFRLLDHHYSHR